MSTAANTRPRLHVSGSRSPLLSRRLRPFSVLCAILAVAAVGRRNARADRSPSLGFKGPERSCADVQFLRDLTYLDTDGNRIVEQQIFEAAFSMIRDARRFVLLDFFLFNALMTGGTKPVRPLCRELTDTLLEQKRLRPELVIVLITDPINTVYGGLEALHLTALTKAGVHVVITDLDRLPDSNPVYSLPWRLLVRPFGNPTGNTLPNPLGPGRVPLRSYLRLFNFKANHRKVVVADSGPHLVGLVTSANPHDGSSAHGNIAVRFRGPAVRDLIETELAVARFSRAAVPILPLPTPAPQEPGLATTVQVVTESKIKQAVLEALAASGPGAFVDLVMFYLSDRAVIDGLQRARRAGAVLRVLLDPNKDAFGHTKNGVPNRPVANDLVRAGIRVRWADTHGEQSHAKMLLVTHADGNSVLVAGSANFTRRNLDDFNLETDVVVRGPAAAPVFRQARGYVAALWHNTQGRHFSVPFSEYAERTTLKRVLYRVMEASGLSTF